MKKRTLYPLIIVNLLFVMWGFIWNIANVLVALFQETFELNNLETSLLTSISFLAFFGMSYPAKLIIQKLKTKRSIVLGAALVGLGLLVFMSGAVFISFGVFLAGTFVMFSGVTFLQIVCNPYVRALGSDDTAASRINFSQGLGAIGAFLTAYIAGGFILKLFQNDPFQGIIWFYLILVVIFFTLAILVYYADMPPNPTDESVSPEAHSETGKDKQSAWNYRHFRIGIVVMFLYMGAEAILYQLMTPYFMGEVTMTKAHAVDISGILFLGLMIGRLMGAGILLKVKPGSLVGWFSGMAAAMIIVSMLTKGYVAVYAIVIIGFFISIMFASLYSLAIVGLGTRTNEASSFLIMSISGGFFIPLIYGLVADSFTMKTSLIVVLIPLLIASWYGFRGSVVKTADVSSSNIRSVPT